MTGDLRIVTNEKNKNNESFLRLSPSRTYHYWDDLKFLEAGSLIIVLFEIDSLFFSLSCHGFMYVKDENVLLWTNSIL